MTLNCRAKMQHFTYFRQPSKNLAHLQCSCLNRFWFADFWRENSKYLLFFAICRVIFIKIRLRHPVATLGKLENAVVFSKLHLGNSYLHK